MCKGDHVKIRFGYLVFWCLGISGVFSNAHATEIVYRDPNSKFVFVFSNPGRIGDDWTDFQRVYSLEMVNGIQDAIIAIVDEMQEDLRRISDLDGKCAEVVLKFELPSDLMMYVNGKSLGLFHFLQDQESQIHRIRENGLYQALVRAENAHLLREMQVPLKHKKW
jgi:hypothetical protein